MNIYNTYIPSNGDSRTKTSNLMTNIYYSSIPPRHRRKCSPLFRQREIKGTITLQSLLRTPNNSIESDNESVSSSVSSWRQSSNSSLRQSSNSSLRQSSNSLLRQSSYSSVESNCTENNGHSKCVQLPESQSHSNMNNMCDQELINEEEIAMVLDLDHSMSAMDFYLAGTKSVLSHPHYLLHQKPGKENIKEFNHHFYNLVNNNGSYDVAMIINYNPSLIQLIQANLIKILIIHQDGSRYIQSLIRNTIHSQQREEVSLLVEHLLDLHKNKKLDLSDLASHKYGNYAVSLIFQLCSNLELELLFNEFLHESIISISESFYGARFALKILDILLIKQKDLLPKLLKQFENKIFEICSEHDSYDGDPTKYKMIEYPSLVIQKIMELNLSYDAIKFIGDALDANLYEFCDTIYGSRIVQKFISYYPEKLDVLKLFDDKESYFKLSKSEHGNFTIQKIIKRDEVYSGLWQYDRFRHRFIGDVFNDCTKLKELSINKYGSTLIEKCIDISTRKQINKIVKTMCEKDAYILSQILHVEYGQFVARTLLRTCADWKYESEARRIVNVVDQHIISLRNCNKYGQSYVDIMGLTRCSSFIKQCCNLYFRN